MNLVLGLLAGFAGIIVAATVLVMIGAAVGQLPSGPEVSITVLAAGAASSAWVVRRRRQRDRAQLPT